MSKKIASEFSIGLVLLIAIVVGGIFFLESKKQEMVDAYISQQSLSKQQLKQQFDLTNGNIKTTAQACAPHYYEGEATVQGWLANPGEIDNGQLIVRLRDQDIKKLPVKNQDTLSENLTAILIDPTEKIREDLKTATEQNPANLTVRGYASVCEPFSRISNQQATIAFKKAKS